MNKVISMTAYKALRLAWIRRRARQLQRAFSADMANVLDPEAIDAIRAVLRRDETRSFGGKRTTKNVSKCHPLAVNNLVTRAMNMAAGISAKTVNAALIEAAFQGDQDA